MKLRGKILSMVMLPIVILAVCIYVICNIEITSAMKDKIQQSLKGTSIVLEQEIMSESAVFAVKDGKLYYGDKNITDDTVAVDELRNGTNIVATIFFGDTRYMSSILDKSTGKPILGTKASDKVINEVLKGGNEYFIENVDIEGADYFAYYKPLYDSSSSNPVGMIFMGMNQDEVESQISSILTYVIAVIAVVAVVLIVVVFLIVQGMSKKILAGVKNLKCVADGDLTITIDEKDKKSKDEIGEMNRAVEALRDNLINIVNDIKNDSDGVHEFSADLGQSMGEASTTVAQVEIAVGDIAEGATSQASDTQTATENVIDMGRVIEETGREVESLHANAELMNKSSDEADRILGALQDINNKTKNAIEEIYEQTNTTNKAALKIQEATDIIASIANETNLLSLNASIEAARAGEAGRGFAVVADQIQKLAEQSKDSVKQIEGIVGELISNSQKAVVTMDEVKSIVDEQNDKIDMTSDIFGQVKSGIDKSVTSINVIDEKTRIMDNKRETVVDVVQNLSAIAQENAASTEETSASVTEVSAVIADISERSLELANIAGRLKQSVDVFKV